MSDIKWEEPPADGRSVGQWEPVADALRLRPGQWALIAEDVSGSLATSIKRGRIRAFNPAGQFEAVCRGASTENKKIYARYVGGDAE